MPLNPRPAPAGPDIGAFTRRLQRQIQESQHGAAGPINQSRPVADPLHQSAPWLLSFNNTTRIVYGCITGGTAIANAYRIYYEKEKRPGIAYLAPDTSCGVTGPRSLNTLQPGTEVLCAIHPGIAYGFILGVVPPPGLDAQQSVASILFGASRNRVDEAHKAPLRMAFNGMIADMLAGRPFDATLAGEVGWIGSLGLRLFMDDWLAQLAVDEGCGLTAFYHDQLLRLAAYNHQHWTACREHESLNDQGELLDWNGYAVYAHEQFGQYSPTANPFVTKTAEQWQKTQPYYSNLEPADDRQMPWHRLREFRGYLGQGGKFLLQGLPDNASPSQHSSYAGGTGLVGPVQPGLLDISATLAGHYTIQAAKGISVSRRGNIVSPSRLRRPEQPAQAGGDDPSNYLFAGFPTDAENPPPSHPITDVLANQAAAADKQLSSACGLLDLHAYLFNYASIHPFHWHGGDWTVPEESAAVAVDGVSTAIPPFDDLANSMYLDAAPFKKSVPIDHRYGDATISTLPCGFDLLDDGGVVHYGGFAEELKFVGGSGIVSVPGDLWLKAGRNIILWAGDQIIERARNAIDQSVTNGSIRQKAQTNHHMISGNGGTGSTLIENRGASSSYDFTQLGDQCISQGIMFKSKIAPIVSLSAGLYLRTGGGDVAAGPIFLDASRGGEDIISCSGQRISYLGTGATHFFGTTPDNIRGANSFSATKTVFCSPLQVAGGVTAAGDVTIRGNFVAAQGHVITERAAADPRVQVLQGSRLSSAYAAVAQGEETASKTLPTFGDDLLSMLTTVYYDDNRPGNDDAITKIGFSFRQLAEYRTQDFRIYEDRWQQMGRLSGKATATWEETAVDVGGIPTYPYPGRENFDGSKLMTQDLTIFSAQNQRAGDRGKAPDLSKTYRNPSLATPQAHKLSEYLIAKSS